MKTNCERIFRSESRSSCEFTAVLLMVAVFGLMDGAFARAQSLPVYSIFQGQQFMQAGDMPPSLLMRPAYWECSVHGLSPNQIRAVKVITPLAKANTLSLDSTKENASVVKDYPSVAARGAVFPAGSYLLEMTRNDNSVFAVTLMQSDSAYPAAPRFSNLLSIQISAGHDLRLDWVKGANTTADDYFVAQVSGINPSTMASWEFRTAWPGQVGALTGLDTTATVPGSYLKPNDILSVVLTQFRISDRQTNANGMTFVGSATAISTTLSVPDQPQGNDVTQYRLLSGRVLKQDSESAPIAPVNSGFEFTPTAWGVAEDRLTNVTLGLPTGASLGFTPSSDQTLWETNLIFDSENQLITMAPPGTYGWTFKGVGGGTQTAALLTGSESDWPAALTVANWSALQTSSFTNNVAVRWTAPAGVSASDLIELVVIGPNGKVIYRNPDYANGDQPIPATETQLTIRAKKLTDGVDYEGRLRHLHLLQNNTQALSGATGVVARCTETRLKLGSRVAFPLQVLTTKLPGAEIGTRYNVQLVGNWGRRPYSWSLVQGSLPKGLQLNANGAITGVPTANGTYAVVVKAMDAISQSAIQALQLDVVGTLEPLEVATTSLPRLIPGIFYFAELSVRGGVEPYQWSIASGRLPNGVELQSCCGIIAGEPKESGDFAVALRLEDGAGQVHQRQFTLSVPAEALEPLLKIKGFAYQGAGPLALGLSGQPGDPITVEASSDLISWKSILSTTLSTSGAVEVPALPGQLRFVRARFGHDRPVPNPLQVKPAIATNRFAEGTIYTNSLSLRLTNDVGIALQLDIPTNAVARPERIRMSLVQSIAALPLDSLLWAVEFQPDGLSLLRPATLTVTYPGGAPANAVSFAYGSQGQDCHLNPAVYRNGQVIVPIQHFSGEGQGQGTQQQVMNLSQRPPCLPMYGGEQTLAAVLQQSYPDEPSVELMETAMTQWFNQSVLPNLKQAEKNDQSLDTATKEFLRWSYLSQFLKLGAWNETGMKSLAQGMANAITKAESRCGQNFSPGEFSVMIGRDQQALVLGLEKYAPDALNTEKVFDRVSRCLRFELKLESIIDVPGQWVEQVRTEQLRFKWDKKDISEGGDIYIRAEESANLELVSWDFYKQNVRPTIGTGSFKGIWLKLSSGSSEEGSDSSSDYQCLSAPPVKTPSTIECFFKVEEPLLGMDVQDADGNWHSIAIPENAGGRWASAFKEAHLDEWNGLPDLDGNEMTGFDFDDWEIDGGEVYATKEITGPIDISQGRANETTYLELRHAPQVNKAP